jgi:hypothetical protein
MSDMSAADHVSPQQWITIHHMSDHPDPPHILGREKVNGYSNAIPEALHMGTDKTVESHFLSHRPYQHTYQVPISHVYPVAFGDEAEFIDKEHHNPSHDEFVNNMSGRQEGLFETMPMDPQLSIKTQMAVPYRNRVEGPGELSYLVPKSIIGENSPVKYVGMTRTQRQVK